MSDKRFDTLVMAGTDFIIGFFGALMAAITATGGTAMPSKVAFLFCSGTGAVAFARTIQQSIRKEGQTTEETLTLKRTTPPPPDEASK